MFAIVVVSLVREQDNKCIEIIIVFIPIYIIIPLTDDDVRIHELRCV